MEKWKYMTFPDFYFLGKITERNITKEDAGFVL